MHCAERCVTPSTRSTRPPTSELLTALPLIPIQEVHLTSKKMAAPIRTLILETRIVSHARDKASEKPLGSQHRPVLAPARCARRPGRLRPGGRAKNSRTPVRAKLHSLVKTNDLYQGSSLGVLSPQSRVKCSQHVWAFKAPEEQSREGRPLTSSSS